MEVHNQSVAKIELLIRRPVAEVFEAFVSPQIITKFWFDRSSGRLEKDRSVRWYWDTFDASTDVRVIALEENERILIEWDAEKNDATTVEWKFEARSEDTTYVSVKHQGFSGDGDAIVSAAIDATGGFALVLAAAKAYLEHGVQLNIVADRF